MINAAVIMSGTVVNVIYIDRANYRRFKRMGLDLCDASPLGLATGDTTDGVDFFRGGEKLPLATGE